VMSRKSWHARSHGKAEFNICMTTDTPNGRRFCHGAIRPGTVANTAGIAGLDQITKKEALECRAAIATVLEEDFASVHVFDDDLAAVRFFADQWPNGMVDSWIAQMTAHMPCG
jgi:hypothetical protein